MYIQSLDTILGKTKGENTMKKTKQAAMIPSLTHEVVSGIKGFQLDAYLVALEGWRRGLTLKWYKDETDVCKLVKMSMNPQGKFYSLQSDKQIHYFLASRGDLVSNEAVRICREKNKTIELLKKNGVPTTHGHEFNIRDKDGMIDCADNIGFPVVLKPVNGSMGKGVHINIQNKEELANAIQNAHTTYKNFETYLIEKFYPGNEYRLYVVGDQVIGATNRVPANITGDGINTVETLIEIKNNERKSNPYLASKPIKIDYEVSQLLKKVGYNQKSIPKKGETVFLREKSNLSSGGDSIDATSELSEEVKQIAVDALKSLPNMANAGVDVIVDPESNKKGVILEINATAEIAFHPFPLIGEGRDVPAAIIDYYFPETIGREKSKYYFDYNSILGPLKTWAAEEVTVSNPPNGFTNGKKYIVTGKILKVGYMSWIRRQALKRNLIGYAQKIGKDKLEVVVAGKEKEKVDKFMNLCKKGSKKSRVDEVRSQNYELDQPMKIGFELISSE